MPYKLQGTSVVKSDSGEVVKRHPTREKALAHLRALKTNVEEGSPALGALLEGFDNAAHPRGWHGRWVGTSSGKVLRVFHGSAHVGDARPERGQLLSNVAQVATDAGRSMTSVEARRVVNDAAGSPEPTPRVIPRGGNANELRGGIPMVTPNPMSSSSRERGLADIEAGRRSDRPRIRPEDRAAFDPITMLGREGTAARERGAGSRAVIHADIRDKLTNLPEGQRYGLAGPQGGVGHVLRKSGGFEVYTSGAQPDKVHKTPSAAAAHAMKLERTAFEGTQRTADVMARNYRHGQEVRAMNERQAKRAEEEAARQRQISARRLGARDALGVPRVRESAPAPAVLGALLEGR